MNWLISPSDFLHPQLSIGAQACLRASYGFLLFFTLVQCLPHWRRFFVSERWGGYAKSAPDVDCIQNPVGTVLVGAVWFLCAIMLTVGVEPVVAAGINLVLCRYFFVRMRWKGVLRGMGAPGFMSYWLAAVVFFLELTTHYAPQQRDLALLVAQVDFAFIMLSAGIYKFTAGYARNEGMELGMVNPEWGFWWKFYKSLPPSSILFKVLNQLAWTTEVVAGVLMLIPQTRFLGGTLILLSFIFIACNIRLGLLCEVVIACCFLYFHPGSLGDLLLNLCCTAPVAPPVATTVPLLGQAVHAFLITYLMLLPLAHAGLFFNFYGKRSLPKPLQIALEKYTNLFGLIIWRVFSVDVINFFVNVYQVDKQTGERKLYSDYGWRGGFRYDSVAESITVTCLFTTLKYYASNQDLFNERLLRYARTVPCAANEVLEFEYMSVRKAESNFCFDKIASYIVDPRAATVDERIVDSSISVRATHAVSPVHEGAKPGSYVPLGK